MKNLLTLSLSGRWTCQSLDKLTLNLNVGEPLGGGGGGTLIFSSYVGSYPASTIHHPPPPQKKKYRESQAPPKIFEILATPKNIPDAVPRP